MGYPIFQTEAHEPYPELNGRQIIRHSRGFSVQTVTYMKELDRSCNFTPPSKLFSMLKTTCQIYHIVIKNRSLHLTLNASIVELNQDNGILPFKTEKLMLQGRYKYVHVL